MNRRRWWTLGVISAATAMLLLDVTVVYVALPSVQADLGASFSELQWVVDAYTVALAATLLAAGTLADRIGRRTVFIGGLALFTAFSALCGAASSPVLLDLSRGVQGIGAAAMFAASLSLLAHEFQGASRGFALGVWGAITGAAMAVGPLVGGLVVDGLSWRWIFLINLPIGALLILMAKRWLQESREADARPLDVPGMLAFGTAAFLLVLALIRGEQDGWGSTPIVLAFTGAAVATVAFVGIEVRSRAPMLPFSLFRIPAFSGTALVAFAQSVAIYPLYLYLAIYFQDALGLSATETGLSMLPMTLVIFVVAPISGKLTARLPLRVPLTIGLVGLAAGLLLMRGLTAGDEWTVLLPGMILGGAAIGAISPALAAAMVSVLPIDRSGFSSGINNTSRQLGIAIGIALLGAIFHAGGPGDAGMADGLNTVFAVAALVALAGAAISWPLLGSQRSSPVGG